MWAAPLSEVLAGTRESVGNGDLFICLLNTDCAPNMWAWNCTVSWQWQEAVSQLDFLAGDRSGTSPWLPQCFFLFIHSFIHSLIHSFSSPAASCFALQFSPWLLFTPLTCPGLFSSLSLTTLYFLEGWGICPVFNPASDILQASWWILWICELTALKPHFYPVIPPSSEVLHFIFPVSWDTEDNTRSYWPYWGTGITYRSLFSKLLSE